MLRIYYHQTAKHFLKIPLIIVKHLNLNKKIKQFIKAKQRLSQKFVKKRTPGADPYFFTIERKKKVQNLRISSVKSLTQKVKMSR